MTRTTTFGDRAGAYLTSLKNAIGLATGAAAAVGTYLTGAAGPLWPVVVVAAYGIGALVTPGPKPVAPTDFEIAASGEQWAVDLRAALARVTAGAPEEAAGEVQRITDACDVILQRWEAVQSSGAATDVQAAITSYLPESLATYARIPKALRSRRSARTGRSPAEMLHAQLGLLARELEKVRDAAVDSDIAALEVQGRFLTQKLSPESPLDLG